MMKSTSAATSSIRIQRYVMVMRKRTRKFKMTIVMMTTMMTMLKGHFSDKHSSPKGKKVQLRRDNDKERMKSDRNRKSDPRKENGNYMMTLMKHSQC